MSRWTMRGSRALATAASLAVIAAACGRTGPSARLRTVWTPAPAPIVFNDNGAWSWFEDERAAIDSDTDTLLVSSVANASGTDGRSRDGNVEVVSYDLATGVAERTVLHAGLEASRHAGDGTAWEPERTFEHGGDASYSNLYPAVDRSDRVLYALVRSVGRDPHLLVSRDEGSTWSAGGRLLDGPGRPYVRYAADPVGRLHFITTEQHPGSYPTSIYHGVIAGGRLLGSDCAVVDADLADNDAARADQLTKVFSGNAARRARTVDLQVDGGGRPYAAFSAHFGTGDNRYYYARFDGIAWRVHFMAYAGTALYEAERFYTGLVALHPADPRRVFVSTDVHPGTGDPLISHRDHRQHHELFEGITVDGGASWTWTAVTANSTADNLRPIVPIWDADHTALLWLRGTYTTYHDYDLDVVGIITDHRPARPPPPDRSGRPS